ncbi:MAG: DUF460 domain-containing protein [Candidatus Micrarchaeota archaeon]
MVGIDGGATTALAVLDYDGNVIALASRKNWLQKDFVKQITDAGTPSVIACDTNPPSRLARKLKAWFHAKLFYPRHSLTQLEKTRIADGAGAKPKNLHERDALAAAAKAYHHFENKLRQAKAKAAARGPKAVQRVQKAVMAGRQMAETLKEFDD